MDIYIYSDESGVFDKAHNDFFVFGWVVFFSKKEKLNAERKYAQTEKVMKESRESYKKKELKASFVTNRDKSKLFRSTNHFNRGAIIIDQKKVLDDIFQSKKDKQRFLDYAFKIGVKKHLEYLLKEKNLNFGEVENIHFFNDEHTTATNGLYELRESLRREFKYGTYNVNWSKHFPPIFKNIKDVSLKYCSSERVVLIRASDIVANKVYYYSLKGDLTPLNGRVFYTLLP